MPRSICWGRFLAEGNENEAITHLMKAEKARSRQPDLHVKLGNVYLKMKRWPDAERSFREALAIDSDYVEAHLGLCQIYLNKKRNLEAAEAALSAVGSPIPPPERPFPVRCCASPDRQDRTGHRGPLRGNITKSLLPHGLQAVGLYLQASPQGQCAGRKIQSPGGRIER